MTVVIVLPFIAAALMTVIAVVVAISTSDPAAARKAREALRRDAQRIAERDQRN